MLAAGQVGFWGMLWLVLCDSVCALRDIVTEIGGGKAQATLLLIEVTGILRDSAAALISWPSLLMVAAYVLLLFLGGGDEGTRLSFEVKIGLLFGVSILKFALREAARVCGALVCLGT